MSKVLPATCAAGVVTAGIPPLPLPTALVQSAGIGPSTGIVIIDELAAYYLPKGSPDLATTLGQVVAALTQVKTALDQIGSALTAIDTHVPLVTSCGAGAGTATWVPVAAANITAIATAGTAIQAAKTALNTLSGALI